jgi:hypothetical protein
MFVLAGILLGGSALALVIARHYLWIQKPGHVSRPTGLIFQWLGGWDWILVQNELGQQDTPPNTELLWEWHRRCRMERMGRFAYVVAVLAVVSLFVPLLSAFSPGQVTVRIEQPAWGSSFAAAHLGPHATFGALAVAMYAILFALAWITRPSRDRALLISGRLICSILGDEPWTAQRVLTDLERLSDSLDAIGRRLASHSGDRRTSGEFRRRLANAANTVRTWKLDYVLNEGDTRRLLTTRIMLLVDGYINERYGQLVEESAEPTNPTVEAARRVVLAVVNPFLGGGASSSFGIAIVGAVLMIAGGTILALTGASPAYYPFEIVGILICMGFASSPDSLDVGILIRGFLPFMRSRAHRQQRSRADLASASKASTGGHSDATEDG